MGKITVLIADDHKLIRESIAMIVRNDLCFDVIALCSSAEEAIDKIMTIKPHIVIMDINLGGMSGIEAIPFIRKYSPGTKILGMSLHTQPAYMKKMMQAGASGYLTKNSSCEELITALREIHHGNKYICAETKDILSNQILAEPKNVDNFHSLTTRELEIINMLKNGLTSRQISQELKLAIKTVQTHRYNILRKLELPNTITLVNFMSQRSGH